jgi:hypothetical protein
VQTQDEPPPGSGPAAAGSMKPNGVPNVTVVSKRRVCVGSTHICSFDNMIDLRHTISLMDSRRLAQHVPSLKLTRMGGAAAGPLPDVVPNLTVLAKAEDEN